MGTPLDFKRSGWIWQVTILSIVLGMLLAGAFKTQQSVRSSTGIPTTRFSGLAQILLDEKDKNRLLQNEITDLRATVDRYEQARGEETTQVKLLSDEVRRIRLWSGLMAVEGQGVEITLQDFPGRIPSDAWEDYIIHDIDLRDIINELFASGAEAVSVRSLDIEQRIIASTAVRCVGGPIQINQVEMGAPFVIAAIGPSNTIESALTMHGGILDKLRPNEKITEQMVKIKKKDRVVVPAFSGNTSIIWSKPVDGERRSE